MLAVSGARRALSLSDVSTFAKSDFPDLVASSRYAGYAHANTPDAGISQRGRVLRHVLALREAQAKLTAAGHEPLPGSDTAQVVRITQDAAAYWLPVIRKSGFRGN